MARPFYNQQGGGRQGGRNNDGSFIAFRPEVALRRARDMMKIDNMRDACEHLHDVLVSKRMGRFWNQFHEDMMVQFIDLCTDLRETRRTKDGLYFYRQLTQMQNPQSLEKIVHYMIDSAGRKAAEARARLGETAGTTLVEDLEEEEQSPESMLMGAVTSEGARERAEREILVPWLRHVWDTFRNVLENIRYVPRLEAVYHTTVVKAMAFCKSYGRTAEYKKLCTMLRNHLMAQRRSQENNGIVMSQEQIERHLTTRFAQLEHCADMNLWNEAYRTVEDIFGIMALTDVPPKAQLMATYFEKLARIFWVSENYLFHAYAWYKFFNLSFAQNKALSEEDKRNMASAVVLAALAIPVYSAGPGASTSYNTESAAGAGSLDFDNERDKKSKLATLLKHASMPSRESLLAEINAKNVLKYVRPEVANLFNLAESEFSPLTLIARAEPSLAKLRAEGGPTLSSAGTLSASTLTQALAHSLAQYVPNLEKLLVFRTLQQLSSVYSVFTINSFRGLLGSLPLSFHDVEKLIVRAVKNRLLSIRLNHRDGILRLGDEAVETTNMRRQLTLLAARLQMVVQSLPQSDTVATTALAAVGALGTVSERRTAIFELARKTMHMSQTSVARRKQEIERRKEDAERQRQEDEHRVRVFGVCVCCVCIHSLCQLPSPAHTQDAAVTRPLTSTVVTS